MADPSTPLEDTPSRSTSNRSSSSLTRRMASMLGGRASHRGASSHPLPTSGLQWEPVPDEEEEGRDSLPTNKEELEGRLNFHLGELDRLRRYVELMNTVKAEHEDHQIQVASRGKDMDMSISKLGKLVDDAADARNKYGIHIGYHRWEVERITRQWLRLQESNAQMPALPEVVRHLPNEYEWKAMFLK